VRGLPTPLLADRRGGARVRHEHEDEPAAADARHPPLRTRADVDEIIAAIGDGTVDAIVSDHAPHHADEKALEFDYAPFGIVGLETAVPLACDRLLHGGIVELRRLVELMSCNPARILRLDGGRLDVGAPANVTVLDVDAERDVDPDTFHSLSRNTPFGGWSLRGWPCATVCRGRVVWSGP
jgi:dihydroorotase